MLPGFTWWYAGMLTTPDRLHRVWRIVSMNPVKLALDTGPFLSSKPTSIPEECRPDFADLATRLVLNHELTEWRKLGIKIKIPEGYEQWFTSDV